jgi:hypothetical protein
MTTEVGIRGLSHIIRVVWNEVRGPRGPRNGSCSSTVPFGLETTFFFASDRSATRGWYVIINVANENFKEFPCGFQVVSCLCLQPFRKYTNLDESYRPSKRFLWQPLRLYTPLSRIYPPTALWSLVPRFSVFSPPSDSRLLLLGEPE